MKTLDKILRRYTHLPALIYLVQTQTLSFLSPETWDDRQDAFFIQKYQAAQGLQTVLAVCLSEAPETYHHWYTFAHGPSGVCIAFKREKLFESLGHNPDIRHQVVEYIKLKDLEKHTHGMGQMPFIKRYPFHPECEYRLLYERQMEELAVYNQPINLDCIDRIYLSPWMPDAVANCVKGFLKSSPSFSGLNVTHSKLISNETWMKHAREMGEDQPT